ncbi:class I SAM-dependent methyltransferase [Nakamurella aerolata]|uniref:Class I SAM-dependent methyltransferase n=1 Tax=Nakamurella aerolata TaxID=1656892 RepID=A0A849AA77_9ACTN|nr:class I SAM-dependent methyltransferase [Nakamurella aerolata]NNG37445.1 class I SAM-dependent methyltransferase [Nakamurella aerolata]
MTVTTSATVTPARAGSYRAAATVPGGLAAEHRRLAAQAELSWPQELSLLRRLGLDRCRELVEVGAGNGAVTRLLRRDFPGLTLTAVDIDPELLDPRAGADHTLVADAAALPLPDSSADAVLLRFVVQHLNAPAPALSEAVRVLRPGGLLLVTDVDAALWGVAEPFQPELTGVYRALQRAQQGDGGNRLVARRLTRLLTAAGCVDVALHSYVTTNDNRPTADFAVHLGPDRLAPLVATGELTVAELAQAAAAWSRFAADPQAWVMLLGFTAVGRRPNR